MNVSNLNFKGSLKMDQYVSPNYVPIMYNINYNIMIF